MLAVVLVVYIICDILLTPVGGLETRPVADVTSVGFVTLGLLFVGFALAIASIILLFSRPRRSPIMAIVGSVLYFPAFLADQAGLFSPHRPPVGIASLEIIQAAVAIVAIFFATRVYAEKTVGSPAA